MTIRIGLVLVLTALIAAVGCSEAEDEAEPTGSGQDSGFSPSDADMAGPDMTTTPAPDMTMGAGGSPDAGPGLEESLTVYEALRPTCVGCHGEGTNLPIFASFDAFNNLLVADPTFVVPGEPESSELVALLKGESRGMYAQMPLGNSSFAELAELGLTNITVAEIEAWIAGLDGATGGEAVPPSGSLAHRLRAEQILTSLYQQLGLEESDFWSNGLHHGYYEVVGAGGSASRYPIRSPDAPPGWGSNSPVRVPSIERFHALGGPGFLSQRKRSNALDPTFLNTLVQVSQAWCRRAIDKDGNTALLREASLADTVASNPDAIRANIAYLHLRLLAEPASADDVDRLFQNIFVPLEANADTAAAWTGICAALVRDPLWITY